MENNAQPYSADLSYQQLLSEIKGKRMRQFALAYPDFEFVQASLAQISWYHNITLLQKCKDEIKGFWYAAAALANGWSRDVLVHQIESKLYERQKILSKD